MTIENPSYWLCYLSESDAGDPTEVTAIAPDAVDMRHLGPNARRLLAVSDGYWAHHAGKQVIFAAELTRWIHNRGYDWDSLNVDFYEALAELDRSAPALLIEANDICRAVVADTAIHSHMILYADGRIDDLKRHTEPVRAALLIAIEHDWQQVANRTASSGSVRKCV